MCLHFFLCLFCADLQRLGAPPHDISANTAESHFVVAARDEAQRHFVGEDSICVDESVQQCVGGVGGG